MATSFALTMRGAGYAGDARLKFTLFLASYAAILSTAVFIWNIIRARPRVRVKIVHGAAKVNQEYVGGAYIFVQNPSVQTVHVVGISLVYPSTEVGLWDRLEHLWTVKRFPRRVGWCHTSLSNYDIDDKCPVSIEPGMSHSVFVPRNIIEKVLEDAISRRFVAVAQDALWRDKYSREFEYLAQK